MRRAAILVAVLALASGVAAGAAPDDAERRSFLTASLYPGILGGNGGKAVVSSISFNLLGGERGTVDGAEFGGAFNLVMNNVSGFQAAGLFNSVHGGLRGLELSGCSNWVSGGIAGAQLAGLINRAGDVAGFQASGAVNISRGRLSGAQLGVVNIADESAGLQLGIVNVARKNAGLAFGLVSVEEDGILEGVARLEIAPISASASLAAGIKFGAKRSYTVLCASVPATSDSALAFDLGWGVRLDLDQIRADLDVGWRSEYEMAEILAGDHEPSGSAVFRVELKHRRVPLAVGLASRLLFPGISRGQDGVAVSRLGLSPGFFVGAVFE